MQNQNSNPYDSVNFRTNLSLKECLQRLEDYQNSPQTIVGVKKSIIIIKAIKVDEIYAVEALLNHANLKVQLEADGDGCLVAGQVHYDWLSAIVAGMAMFSLVWIFSKFSLSLGQIIFYLAFLLGGSLIIAWFVAVSSGDLVKQRFIELLKVEAEDKI